MDKSVKDLFTDPEITAKIQTKFPILFHMAEEETKRDGRIGMEVGTMRERIVVSLLIYYFGEQRVNTHVPTTEAEKDVILDNIPISIKTITSKSNYNYGGVKVSWTVDAAKAKEFADNYTPTCDILFVQISWANIGAFYYIPKKVQQDVLLTLGSESFIKLPKAGTNPRGIEFSNTAFRLLCENKETFKLAIDWKKPDVQIDVYQKWIELWQQD
ncbi:MAG: type II restriction endonuclease subunit R [Candidatus Cloacimonetes bacterium HGW-Cloacimonetes-3]|nr:MAG: type II restriction endonuclease subunit R [Candidatus Cloacimonetes bacterium HGW-Cloacimonetes-3]